MMLPKAPSVWDDEMLWKPLGILPEFIGISLGTFIKLGNEIMYTEMINV